MVAAVAPYGTPPFKTVNVPVDYPTRLQRPVLASLGARPERYHHVSPQYSGAVLSVTLNKATLEPITLSEQDKRLVLTEVARTPPLASLRWPSRPGLPAGAAGWVSEMIETPQGEFAIAVADKDRVPFEVWVLGGQPARADAIAKRCRPTCGPTIGWLRKKLSVLSNAYGDGFDMPMPPHGQVTRVPMPPRPLPGCSSGVTTTCALDPRDPDPPRF